MTKHITLMKKQFDFLQEAKRGFTPISLLYLTGKLSFAGILSLWRNNFILRYFIFCFIFLTNGDSFLLGQTVTIDASITAPTSVTGDICEGVPQTIQATSSPAGKPLIWRSKDVVHIFV